MFAGGGGIEDGSGGALVGPVVDGFFVWLNLRIKEALRAGRVSVPVPGANASGPMFVRGTAVVADVVAGSMPTPPPPGAGKSLRSGSYAEMLACKSSKLTEGRKLSLKSLDAACGPKLKRGLLGARVETSLVAAGRKERFAMLDATLASEVTLQGNRHQCQCSLWKVSTAM